MPSLEVLVGVGLALKGNPSQIHETIKTQFPKRRGPVKTKSSVYAQHRRLRENLIDGFSLGELKDICFGMEINYETLPDHGHLNGFVRELLAHAERIGRSNELVQVCQAQRPHLEW